MAIGLALKAATTLGNVAKKGGTKGKVAQAAKDFFLDTTKDGKPKFNKLNCFMALMDPQGTAMGYAINANADKGKNLDTAG